MPRPSLVLETWGKIRRTTIDGKPTAVASYRDSDGKTRTMQRQGTTAASAERVLVKALRDRLTPSDGIKPETRLKALSQIWWDEFEKKGRAVGTERHYRLMLSAHILPGIGDLTIREASVSRLDRFIKALTVNSGYGSARTSAVVLTGMMGLAARHGAITVNPMGSVAPVVVPANTVVVHTIEEVGHLRALLKEWDAGKDKGGQPRRAELSDVATMFLATGCRTGEVLSFQWSDIDMAATPPTITVSGTAALDKNGKRVIQAKPKSESSQRQLALPAFVVEMLLRRRVDSHSPLVFPSTVGTLRDPNNFLLQWHNALKGSPFEGAVPKTFRSSVATIIASMADAEAAQKQLGHSSRRVTEGSYIKRSNVAPDLTGILEAFNVLATSSTQNHE